MDKFVSAPRRHLFFMHIPKTAGLSLRAYLSNQYRSADIFPFGEMREALHAWHDAPRYRLIMGHFRYNMRQALIANTKMMTVVRDPLIRTVSSLRHLQRDPSFHSDHEIARGMTVSQMIRHPTLISKQMNVQTAFLSASAPIGDVFKYLGDVLPTNPAADGSELEEPPDLAIAVERLSRIDHIGVTEQLGKLVHEIAETMNYHPVAALPVMNEAQTPSVLDLLSEADLSILHEHNELDMKLYQTVLALNEQRAFERAMRRLVESGTYRRLSGSFAFDLGAPVPGSGWYEPESADGSVWRWTGPGSKFTIEVPLRADADYRIEMDFNTRFSGQENGLSATVNGETAELALQPNGRRFFAFLNVPRAVLARSDGFCRIAFDLGPATDAQPGKGDDLRKLGVVVYSLAIDRRQVPVSAAVG